MKKQDLLTVIDAMQTRSAWSKGVKEYAFELVEDLPDGEELSPDTIREKLLNGATSWTQYSYGGCSLVYDEDIAERLCTPSELKRKDGGRLPPNSRTSWLDVQARALFHASSLIVRTINKHAKLYAA